MVKITASLFKDYLKSASANLSNHSAEINKLNVFPVPDGDTGTNMSLTFTYGTNEALKVSSDSISDVAKAFSKGLLMGARGNSGVITSQIFRGFYQHIEGLEELTVENVALAFENGVKVAYKAIMKPVEGTILTVIREASWYANHEREKNPDMDLVVYFENLHKYAYESLERTPEYLPVLKEVGVVDSGGMGLLKIIEGFLKCAKGEVVEYLEKQEEIETNPALMLENEEFGYCTEFIIRLAKEYLNRFDEKKVKQKLTDIGGESLVLVRDDDLVKVHVHVLSPGDALNIGQRYGEFIKLKIENMQEQHSSIIASKKEKEEKPEVKNKTPQKYGIVTVAAGEGLTNLFKEIGADVVISGGQSMNPSCEDFVKVINDLDNCDNIVIFPNNSNIILAAKQAKQTLSDRNIFVCETKSIQAGISAIMMFDKNDEVEDLLEKLNEIISMVDVSSVTYAIKNTTFDGVEVKEGDYIAINANKIVSSNKDIYVVLHSLLDTLFAKKDKEILTIIVGEAGNDAEVEDMKKYIEDNSSLEYDVIQGDQPVYAYLFGLE